MVTHNHPVLLDPYVTCDSELRLLWANEPAERLAGHTHFLPIGRDVCTAMPWLADVRFDLEAIGRRTADTAQVVTSTHFEHRIRRQGKEIGILSIARAPVPHHSPEQLQREIEERLQLAQQIAGLAVWDLSLESGEITWSPEMFRMLGLEPGQVTPTVEFWSSHVHPDDFARVSAEADETVAACGSRETEFRIIAEDGKVRAVLSRWKVFCGEDGRPARMVGVNLDITQRRELDSRLREINAQLGAIIEASPAPIVALTPEGRVTLWNPAAERLFGWTSAEVVGGPLPFIPAEKRAEHAVLRRRDLEGDSLHSVQLRRVRKDGSPVDISVSTATLRDPHGHVTGIMSLYEDITERLRSERALRESEQRFRTLVETIPQLVWSTTPEGLCEYLSRQWVEYTGVPESRHHGFGWLEALHPEDRTRAADAFAEAVAGRGTYDLEYRLRRHDGQYRWFKTRGLPVSDPDGRVSKWLGTCWDIEEQRSIMDALLRANTDLQQFAYAAAHDLQEPLRNIGLYSQLLQRKYADALPEDAQACLRHALDGAHRMQSLVEDLLAYTQTATVGDTPGSQVDCNEVVRTALENLSEPIALCGARLEVSTLPTVHVHRTRLIQLFQNLLSNAVKYRGSQPLHVRVYASWDDDRWTFYVEDNGQGIGPEYQERIFGVFRRLHGREVPGTGIGLAICKRIIEHYGGRIGVISAGPGAGSTFWFTLPAD